MSSTLEAHKCTSIPGEDTGHPPMFLHLCGGVRQLSVGRASWLTVYSHINLQYMFCNICSHPMKHRLFVSLLSIPHPPPTHILWLPLYHELLASHFYMNDARNWNLVWRNALNIFPFTPWEFRECVLKYVSFKMFASAFPFPQGTGVALKRKSWTISSRKPRHPQMNTELLILNCSDIYGGQWWQSAWWSCFKG